MGEINMIFRGSMSIASKTQSKKLEREISLAQRIEPGRRMRWSDVVPYAPLLLDMKEYPLLLDMKEYLSYSDSGNDGKDYVSFFVNAVKYAA
jgi:hypothetical protein